MKIQIEPIDIAPGFGLIPSGGIIMWSGSIASIPTGWALCDGTNGRPDLRDRFVVGASQDQSGISKTNVSGTLTQSGGSASHSHTINDPGHVHHVPLPGLSAGPQIADSSPSGAFATSQDDADSENSTTGIAVNSTSSLSPYYALAYIVKLP